MKDLDWGMEDDFLEAQSIVAEEEYLSFLFEHFTEEAIENLKNISEKVKGDLNAVLRGWEVDFLNLYKSKSWNIATLNLFIGIELTVRHLFVVPVVETIMAEIPGNSKILFKYLNRRVLKNDMSICGEIFEMIVTSVPLERDVLGEFRKKIKEILESDTLEIEGDDVLKEIRKGESNKGISFYVKEFNKLRNSIAHGNFRATKSHYDLVSELIGTLITLAKHPFERNRIDLGGIKIE